MLKEIISLYRNRYTFPEFYDRLIYNITTWPYHHIKNQNFLSGFEPTIALCEKDNQILTDEGDIRVDLPVWFGNPLSPNRIVIIGMEPRDSDKKGYLNIERNGCYVFATPFALERPKGKYQSAFSEILFKPNFFFYFTDVVKE